MAKPYATEDQLEQLRKLIKSGGGSGKSDLIVVAKDIPLIADVDGTDPEKINGFSAEISETKFPSDFSTSPEKYNLVVQISGKMQNEDETMTLGYVANHFCYLIGESMTTYSCCDYGDNGNSIYHLTNLGYSTDTASYMLWYEGKYEDTTMLPKEGSKASIYLQQLP